MATAAAQLLAKGPLSSALGQWMFIGFGTFVIFTGDNGVSKAAQEVAQIAIRLATGKNASALLSEATSSSSHNHYPHPNQQPIVIHNVSPSSSELSSRSSGRFFGWGFLIQIGIGAGACWGAYIVFSQLLPESVKELLPVTRKFFDTAVTSLGQGIIRVRDALSEQITALGRKQDQLSEKQDSTHSEVLGIKDDIGDVRVNIDDIAIAISRCENSLCDAAGRQTYMSRGVRLLVQCVGDLLRPSNPDVAEELAKFSRMSAEMDGDTAFDDEASPSTPMHHSSSRTAPEFNYPSSPILSEISGSGTAEDMNIRPFSLSGGSRQRPRERRSSQSPAPSAPQTNSNSGMNMNMNMISPSPFHRSPSLPLTGGVAKPSMLSMRSMSRQGSSPEDEVPRSEKVVSLHDVDQLLDMIRNGNGGSSMAIPAQA